MTEITPEALEALSKKATQGVWEIETDPYGAPFPGIVYPGSPFEFADFSVGENGDENQANAELCIALVNLYRTGQLIHAVPSVEITERQSETLHKALIASCSEFVEPIVLAQPSGDEVEAVARKFNLGDRVTKTKGSSWTGLVVGFYSTSLTPIGYAVESENEPGSVQIYPESALEACIKARENSDG